MFCFQCEQTAGCKACTGAAGVCGKTAEVSDIQDELTGALVGWARAWVESGRETVCDMGSPVLERALFATLTNVDFDPEHLRGLIDEVHAKKQMIATTAGNPVPADLDVAAEIWNAPEDVRTLKTLVLLGIRGAAAYAHHARILGKKDNTAVDAFFMKALNALGEPGGADELLPFVLGAGQANQRALQLLDEANREAFGTPSPATVRLGVEAGPFVVVTGHDLHDLRQLLEQTEGRGVNVYTHGEMLPAHAYPELRKYPQLKGNIGGAWQDQQADFAQLPAPVVFTTNCLVPPAAGYADRVYTTGPVAFPGMPRIEADAEGRKDFSAVIEQAIALGGYAEAQAATGKNGGTSVTTGFGHDTVLGVAGAVIDAVKSGQLRHIFLVGGCDGARKGRDYFTEFVKQTPEDTLVLTLACGKFRFNDLDLGTLGTTGLPRLLDMGQCNDAYSAVVVTLALAEAFGCGVNDLPLTLVLSWYEQKAVSILLTLLNLDIKGIYLGPTLPAFVSPAILDFLVQNFDIRPTTTPEADLAVMLG